MGNLIFLKIQLPIPQNPFKCLLLSIYTILIKTIPRQLLVHNKEKSFWLKNSKIAEPNIKGRNRKSNSFKASLHFIRLFNGKMKTFGFWILWRDDIKPRTRIEHIKMSKIRCSYLVLMTKKISTFLKLFSYYLEHLFQKYTIHFFL